MNKIRKLISFYSPDNNSKKYTFTFGFYEDGKYTGEFEYAELEEENFYNILKPYLEYKKEKK